MEKHVLITGASSGIGKATALELANRKDFIIHVGVRKEKDFNAIEAMKNPKLKPILIDVQDKASILQAKEEMEKRLNGKGLFALFNNAGVNYISPFEYAQEKGLRSVVETNIMGPIYCSQLFIPLLLKFRNQNPTIYAKILTTSSIGGHVGLPWEFIYHVSKFANQGMTQSLRYELKPLGIDVTAICPGGVITEFFDKSVVTGNESKGNLPSDANPYYARNLDNLAKMADTLIKNGTTAEKMGKMIADVFEKDKMKISYILGRDAKAIKFMQRWLPSSLFEKLLASQLVVK